MLLIALAYRTLDMCFFFSSVSYDKPEDDMNRLKVEYPLACSLAYQKARVPFQDIFFMTSITFQDLYVSLYLISS